MAYFILKISKSRKYFSLSLSFSLSLLRQLLMNWIGINFTLILTKIPTELLSFFLSCFKMNFRNYFLCVLSLWLYCDPGRKKFVHFHASKVFFFKEWFLWIVFKFSVHNKLYPGWTDFFFQWSNSLFKKNVFLIIVILCLLLFDITWSKLNQNFAILFFISLYFIVCITLIILCPYPSWIQILHIFFKIVLHYASVNTEFKIIYCT